MRRVAFDPLAYAGTPLLAGALLAWSLAAPPGPANAMMAHEAASRGWRAGALVGLGAIAGDAVMFLLMWLGVLRLIGGRPVVELALALAGCALLAYFAYGAWRAARSQMQDRVGSFGKSFVTILTSPFNWGWWLTVGATLFVSLGLAVIAGFFLGLLAWIAVWCALARLGAAYFTRFAHWVAYASAVVLLVFAALIGWYAVGKIVALA